MKKFFQIIGIIFLTIWTLGVSVAVGLNCKGYTFLDWVVMICVILIPYFIYFKLQRNKKPLYKTPKKARGSKTNHAVEFKDVQTQSHKPLATEPSFLANNLINTEALANAKFHENYVVEGNTIRRSDGEPITDEELPLLNQISYNRRVQEANQYADIVNKIYPQDLPKYKLNDDEIRFLSLFYSEVINNKIEPFLFTNRMADGTINVEYKGCQIGRIRLQGRSHRMQILKGASGVTSMSDGHIDQFIMHIPDWVRYIKYIERT